MGSKIDNKELIQSYIITTAKYDFNVYEKRIVYRIVELLQEMLEGKTLDQKYSIEYSLFQDSKITIPVSKFLNSEKDQNYVRIKEAFISLMKKIFEYQDNKEWETFSLIQNPKIVKGSDEKTTYVNFSLNPHIASALMDFSKGYRKYELATAMKFESIYAMRFYELFSKQKKPINYSVDYLREILMLNDKYKKQSDFVRKVIEVAKKELDEKSEYTFEYVLLPEERKKTTPISSIRFIPIFQPQNEDKDLKKKTVLKQMSKRWFIKDNEIEYLKTQYHFTDDELKNNLSLFESAHNNFAEGELIDLLSEIRPLAMDAKNVKGYVIGSIKKVLERKIINKYNL